MKFEISDNDDNDEQKENIYLISVASSVFHFEILGKDNIDEQS